MLYKILLVDDDKDFRDELRDCLDDYKIIEASNGEQALRLLKKPNEIDLVILDVMMPGIKGTEVLKKMKKIAPDLNIIILTGYSSKDIAIEALKAHADDYIEKPINIDKTKEIIEKLLAAERGEDDLNVIDINNKVKRVKRFIKRNYNKNISLKVAAAIICLSPKYLSRIFKQNTGMGFNEYKLAVKTEKAKELLSKTGYNINQIAEELGYQNTESFIRLFKKVTGYTPTGYRKKKDKNRVHIVKHS